MVDVTVTRRFDAPAAQVYDAWLTPELIGRWMFGPALRDEEVLSITADGRVGGSFSFLVRRQGAEIDHVGEYLTLERPRRLVFTWAIRENLPDTSTVTVEIAPAETGCELTLTHQLAPDWADYAERTANAWRLMLGALAEVVAG